MNVRFVPKIYKNLFSFRALEFKCYRILIEGGKIKVSIEILIVIKGD